jgi:deazaflavin-dependent oxidoreductase (nitroreductase family)
MPLPSWLARFNRGVTNRVTRPVAGRLPGFAIVRHRGRRTGRLYRTPVNLFRRGDSVVIALTYGPDRDWVRNVLAAGECTVETRGRVLQLKDPRLVTDPHRGLVPAPVRPVLRAIGVTEFMVLSAASGGGPGGRRRAP